MDFGVWFLLVTTPPWEGQRLGSLSQKDKRQEFVLEVEKLGSQNSPLQF